MKIGELSRQTGVSRSALRFYEQQRLIPPARRRSGQRDYEARDATAVAVVQLARKAGFSIAEVRQLVGEFGRDRWRRLALRKLDQVRETSERLREMRVLLEKLLDCECPDLDFCGRIIQKHSARRGAASRSRR
ncbi:MAG TPA: MerR family transcriptional regulator [Thermoanaerobaculia bacterium]|nr:MerR family transcriptional regulator [Thermoanaerobaculia bacterium]